MKTKKQQPEKVEEAEQTVFYLIPAEIIAGKEISKDKELYVLNQIKGEQYSLKATSRYSKGGIFFYSLAINELDSKDINREDVIVLNKLPNGLYSESIQQTKEVRKSNIAKEKDIVAIIPVSAIPEKNRNFDIYAMTKNSDGSYNIFQKVVQRRKKNEKFVYMVGDIPRGYELPQAEIIYLEQQENKTYRQVIFSQQGRINVGNYYEDHDGTKVISNSRQYSSK